MTNPSIKAITFDLWDTIFIDDSDELKRKIAGKPPKTVERRQLVYNVVKKYNDNISQEIVNFVYDAIDAAFKKVWLEQFVTWSVYDRLILILKGLNLTLPEDELKKLVLLHEEMELNFLPSTIKGVHEAIKELHKRYKLGVISDVVFTPGRYLRKLLEDEGILEMFDVFIFSDEIGKSKPDPYVFYKACEEFGIKPEELVHIGDREHNDIEGAQKIGAKAILCTAIIDRGSSNTKAHSVFNDYKDLPKIIDNLV